MQVRFLPGALSHAPLLPSRLPVTERTIDVRPIPDRTPVEPVAPGRRGAAANLLRQHPWVAGAIALVLVSTGIVVWARARPGYDPYGWLVWGYQTIHLTLDLGGAPSWKPLPYLFTVPYALAGHYELWLWMITSVAVSLGGTIFAGRIAYRLTLRPERSQGTAGAAGAEPISAERRYAAIAAALFAGAVLLGIEDYAHYVLSVQSDPMIVTFVLAAIDSHLSGRPRWAFAFGVLASLGRPESWPFLGLYSLWAWRAIPSMRKLIVAGLALIPAMWFGIPVLSGNDPFVAGSLALRSPRALHESKIVGTVHRFTELQYLPVQLLSVLALVVAFLRRDRLILILGAGAVVWVMVEIAFSLHGWPALPRYLFEPAAVMIVLAAVAIGWILLAAPRLAGGLPKWAGAPVVVVLVATLVPGALQRVRVERHDLHHERARTAELNLLQAAINAVGGDKKVTACGKPVSDVAWVSALAYFVKLDVGPVGHRPSFERHQPYPIVVFLPEHNGWSVLPWHTAPAQRAACAILKGSYEISPGHPNGVPIPG